MMKTLFKIGIITFCFLISAKVCSAQKVDLGKLSQNTYINDFFELKIEFPFGWLVGDNGLEAPLMAIQKGSVKAKNSKNQAALNKAINRITPLLGGYKFLPGSSAENSNLRVVVENLAATPKIKTGKDYLSALTNSLKLTKLPPNYSISLIKTDVIDEKMIDYIEIKYLSQQKRMYALVRKGFAVLLTVDAFDQTDFDALVKVVESSDLDYKKQN